MIELIKDFAFQKLSEAMGSNSLNNEATNEAAQEGTSAILGTLLEKVQGGNLSDITELFSNEGRQTADNPVTSTVKQKMEEILQTKGMSQEDARAEASNVAPNILDSLKEKFLSQNEADKGFDINDIQNVLSGNIGDLLGGDAAGILNKVKGLL